MKVEPIKTRLVHANEISLADLLSESIKTLPENSVVAISSKVVALCENRVVPLDAATREELIAREAEWFIDPEFSPYGYHFTIAGGTLVASAGIDQSNADGDWVLWPRDSFKSASQARIFLEKHFNIKNVGVIIIDSISTPLRRGTIGEMIGWSGLSVVHNYVGSKDLFGRDFKMEMSGVGRSLASAANVVMGEGAEQTPVVLISDIDFVEFTRRDATTEEINMAFVPWDDDIFMPFLKQMPWQRGSGHEKPSEK
jgi:F420-0:gamma-glutamyl ligase